MHGAFRICCSLAAHQFDGGRSLIEHCLLLAKEIFEMSSVKAIIVFMQFAVLTLMTQFVNINHLIISKACVN
jgi:hypothetical protein